MVWSNARGLTNQEKSRVQERLIYAWQAPETAPSTVLIRKFERRGMEEKREKQGKIQA